MAEPVLSATPRTSRRWWAVLGWILVPLLLWWALRRVPLTELLETLRRLQGWQVAVLLVVNIVILILVASRWWLILRSMGRPVHFGWLLAYRTASFGVSYFTPGPHLGGEALQVLVLQRRHAVPGPAAISSVFLDKLLELLANITFLVLGLAAAALNSATGAWVKPWMWLLALLVLAFPGGHLFSLWRGRLPLTWLLRRLLRPWQAPREPGQALLGAVRQAEEQIAALCRERPRVLLHTLGISVIVWVGLVGEYLLMAAFLGLSLSIPQVMLVLTLARLAFLFPLPGGLGALEASQVLAMHLLGLNPALGISISLVIRARDLIFGGIGLGLGGLVLKR